MIESSYVKHRVGKAAIGEGWLKARSALSGAFLGLLLLGGCAHHTNPAQELNSAVAPFAASRDQTIALVARDKHALDAADLNSLAVAYTPLEEKANVYAHFLVLAVGSASFSAEQNNQCALDLTAAINSFNKAFAALGPSKQSSPAISSAWVAPFAASVASYWGKYGTAASDASSQARTDLANQLRNKMLWPNYEDIATEPLATPPH
jgi:hypothetical protein